MEVMAAQLERVRWPVVGELFYPEDEDEILDCFRSYGLEQGKGGNARAIIAPHGAWNLSGSLAAAAFGAAGGGWGKKSPSRVVILGPLHDKRAEGLYLSNSHYFQTPLGSLKVDLDISGELESCSPLFEVNDIPHLQEHSIEVLLPFVKYCFPDAEIVPLLMGRPRMGLISALASALNIVFEPLRDDTLFVVSCNMAMAPTEAAARRISDKCARLFSEKNAAALISGILEGRIAVCGGALVASLIKSGLLDDMQPDPVPSSMLSYPENGNVFYYGAFSFA
jgi:AmmeMemoRadiSam system protein B